MVSIPCFSTGNFPSQSFSRTSLRLHILMFLSHLTPDTEMFTPRSILSHQESKSSTFIPYFVQQKHGEIWNECRSIRYVARRWSNAPSIGRLWLWSSMVYGRLYTDLMWLLTNGGRTACHGGKSRSLFIPWLPYISWHISRTSRSQNEVITRGATHMRGKNIMQINGQQFQKTGLCLWVRLIFECDLYAKKYGSVKTCGKKGCWQLLNFPTPSHPHSNGSWDKSKKPYSLRNCIILNSAIAGAPLTTRLQVSWFLDPNCCLIVNYAISQWV